MSQSDDEGAQEPSLSATTLGASQSEDEGAHHAPLIPSHLDTEYNRQRPRRSNTGPGIQQLQMISGGKSYKSKAANFLMRYEIKQKEMKNRKNLATMANVIMFIEISAETEINLFGEKAVVAMIKEYKQLNQVAVEGKPLI